MFIGSHQRSEELHQGGHCKVHGTHFGSGQLLLSRHREPLPDPEYRASAGMATSLWPSCLISCSQPSPEGGLLQGVTIWRRTSFGTSAGTASEGNFIGIGDKAEIEPRKRVRTADLGPSARRTSSDHRLVQELQSPSRARHRRPGRAARRWYAAPDWPGCCAARNAPRGMRICRDGAAAAKERPIRGQDSRVW